MEKQTFTFLIELFTFHLSSSANLKLVFLDRKFEDMKSKKVQGTFGETFILKLWPSAVFLLQNRVSIFF